jgi:hypothetical protein
MLVSRQVVQSKRNKAKGDLRRRFVIGSVVSSLGPIVVWLAPQLFSRPCPEGFFRTDGLARCFPRIACESDSEWVESERACVAGGVRCPEGTQWDRSRRGCFAGGKEKPPLARAWMMSENAGDVGMFTCLTPRPPAENKAQREALSRLRGEMYAAGLLPDDTAPGARSYEGTAPEVLHAYSDEATLARNFDEAVDEIFRSPNYDTLACAEAAFLKARMYYSLATKLHDSFVTFFSGEQLSVVRQADSSSEPALHHKADEMRLEVSEAWRKRRQEELDQAARLYVQSLLVALSCAQSLGEASQGIKQEVTMLLSAVGKETSGLDPLVPSDCTAARETLGL